MGPLRRRGLPGPEGQGQRLGEPQLPSRGLGPHPAVTPGCKGDGGPAALQPLSGLAARSHGTLTYGRGSVIYKTRGTVPGLPVMKRLAGGEAAPSRWLLRCKGGPEAHPSPSLS